MSELSPSRPRGSDRQRHVDPVVVEAGERRAGQLALDPAHHQLAVDDLDVAAHAVQLQHRDDPVGLLQPHVLDVAEAGLARGELAHRRQHRQHVGHRPAVDLDPAQLQAVVADVDASALVELERQPHLGDDVDEVRLGVVDPRRAGLGQAGEGDVGGVQGGRRQAEGGGADVGRQGQFGGWARLLAAGDLEAAPVLGDLDLEPEVAHHPHRQLDVGLLVELALDLDHRPAGRERGDDQEARDPLREGAGDPYRAAARPPRLDGDRRRRVLGREIDSRARRAPRAAARPGAAGSTSGRSASPGGRPARRARSLSRGWFPRSRPRPRRGPGGRGRR